MTSNITIELPFTTSERGYPSTKEVREASYAEMAEKAIEAWDRGQLDVALAWVNAGRQDRLWVDPKLGEVWLEGHYYPEYGGSPRPVRTTTKLGISPAQAALAAHILSRVVGSY